eukprot:SAG11_NODE_4262_length_1982_cov_1.587892_1_plen_96_part_00
MDGLEAVDDVRYRWQMGRSSQALARITECVYSCPIWHLFVKGIMVSLRSLTPTLPTASDTAVGWFVATRLGWILVDVKVFVMFASENFRRGSLAT